VSIRRAKLAAASEGLLFANSGEQSEVQAIVEWIETSSDGSLQDLPFAPAPEVWDEVASEPDVCMRAKCPHFEQCFYQRARRDAASADLLVVNHHLLFSDIAVRRAQGNYSAPAVLPAYKRIILDEAHNLEDAATEHLGANVSRRGIARLLGRLDRRGRGLLGTVEGKLYGGERDLLQQDALKRTAKLRVMVERAREQSSELFVALESMLARSEDGVLRLTEDFAVHPDWTYASAASFEGTVMVLESIARDVEQLRNALLVDERWSKSLEEQLLELEASATRVRAAAEALRLVFTPAPGSTQLVRWLERRGGIAREPNVSARAAPIDISQTLREALFEQAETVVLTSATLATRTGFGFLRQRIGLGAGLRVTEALYPSPFDYEEQALVLVTSDAPAEFGVEFDTRTVQTVVDVAAASDGGVFVLFTSYRALRNVARDLRLQGVEARWPLFVQGEGSRTRLLERFAQSGRGILLGVSSFWEGVDVPGHPLRALVITKLPFKVPSEPLTAARIEAIDADGRNSFIEYMLPHAALRLKQGFGRLIRSRTDRGVIVLQDRRLLEKSYGRYFLDSLPPARVQSGAWHELRPMVDAFYGRFAPLEVAS
jgi:ATP-dependent DNA helicase DinG